MNMRVVLAILIGLGLIAIAMILVFRAFSSLGGGDQPDAETGSTALVQQADKNSEVRLTIQGPITSEQEHRSIVVSVTKNEARLQVLRGYQGAVMNTVAFANNEASYAEFLRALDLLSFTKGNDNEALSDERGYCPAGSRYVLQASGTDLNTRYWATSCGDEATSAAGIKQVLRLFEAQIPGYRDHTQDVDL
jgi:hypothetical protein